MDNGQLTRSELWSVPFRNRGDLLNQLTSLEMFQLTRGYTCSSAAVADYLHLEPPTDELTYYGLCERDYNWLELETCNRSEDFYYSRFYEQRTEADHFSNFLEKS